ncbi:N-acetyl-alpha-D-glucosaminyl L-malate synthase BshA [bacterium]|nr:N-acetyl-alpha-D-glucosaminyl L-malate synthase BshA [bacterium]
MSKSAKLSIGIVCYPTQGGSGIVAVELAHGLSERGHDVHVISYAVPARLDTLHYDVTFHSVRVPDYPLFEYPPYSLALATKLSEVIEKENLDIVHVHYAIPHAIAGLLARTIAKRPDLPIITTLHGTDITIIGNDPSYLKATRYSLESSDRVTVVSSWLRDQVYETVGCSCNCNVIYNFVDSERFVPDRSHNLCKVLRENKKPTLMHISNFRPVKHVMDVVDTFMMVREQVQVQLVMVGDGPDRIKAEDKLKNSKYANDCHFLGMQRYAEELLPHADIFLFPSNAESFGLAALEAMACGVPVIGTDAGGLPEVVEHGKTGYLYQPGDISGMSEGCLTLLKNTDLHEGFRKAARKRAVEKFPISTVLDQYVSVYHESIDALNREELRVEEPQIAE